MRRTSKYPRIGTLRNLRYRKCSYCEHAAIREIHVQTTWTRGDDEVIYTCYEHDKAHGRDPAALLEALLRAREMGADGE